jgi:hypothetical protein
MTATELKRTPLYERHVALGARMVEFGGWEMPVQYSGIVDEHNAVRHAAGLFDISHMGEFEVKGRDALAFLQHVATQDVATIGPGLANYSLLCRPDGGIVDDIFIYNLTDGYLVVVNASNIEKDYAWMLDHVGGFDVEFTNASDRTSALLDGMEHGLIGKFLHPAVALVMAALFVRMLTTERMAFLAHPGLRLAGLVSYGVYLFHWPVLDLGLRAAGIEAGNAGSPALALVVVLGLSLLAFVIGTVSYVVVERPFLQIGRAPVREVIDLRDADEPRSRVAAA